MPIIKKDEWNEWVKSNVNDPYGKCCVNVARRVMELIDLEPIDKPFQEGYDGKFSTHQLICQADKDIEAGGITGFMAGAVAQMVSQVHSRGEEFRQVWNKKYGVKEEKANGGVVNPAILTIETKITAPKK